MLQSAIADMSLSEIMNEAAEIESRLGVSCPDVPAGEEAAHLRRLRNIEEEFDSKEPTLQDILAKLGL